MTTIILAALVVAVLAVAYVAYPLLRRSAAPGSQAIYDEELGQLLDAREGTYRAIRDLDFDYQTGKLAEDDYRPLRARYAAQAVSIMQALDQRGQEAEDLTLDTILEQEILETRRGRTPRPEETRFLEENGFLKAVGSLTCPECGRARAAEDRFCAGCGASLAQLCPECGTPFDADDRFCARCGVRLSPEAEPAASGG